MLSLSAIVAGGSVCDWAAAGCDTIDAMPTTAPMMPIDFPWRVLIPFSTVDRPRRGLILTSDVARLSLRRRRGGPKPISARSHEHQRFAASSLCTRRDPIFLEGLFELVLDIVRIVGELHDHGVIAGAAATSEGRIILRRPRIIEELHEHGVIAGAAAAGEGRIILRRPRIIGELCVVADAAATGEGWIILSRIVSELCVVAGAAAAGEARIVLSRIVGDDAAEGVTFGDIELVARTYDDCPRAKLACS